MDISVKILLYILIGSVASMFVSMIVAQISQEMGNESLYWKLGKLSVWSWRVMAVAALGLMALAVLSL